MIALKEKSDLTDRRVPEDQSPPPPQDPQGISARAEALLEMGRFEDAKQLYSSLCEADSDNPLGLLGLAHVEEHQRHWNEAITRYENLLARFPNNLDGLRGIAPALVKVGRYDDAASAYRTLCESHPEQLSGWLGLAKVLQDQRRWAEALEAYDNVQKRFPENPEACTAKAEVLSELGQLKQALAVYHQLFKIPSLRGKVVLGLAYASREAEERRAAYEACRQWAGLTDATRRHPAVSGKNLIIGHSHIKAIRDALSASTLPRDNFVTHFLPNRPLVSPSGDIDDQWRKCLILCDSAARVFLSTGGNEHTILGLPQHPVPYAFSEMLAIAGGHETAGDHYIPSSLVKEILKKRMASTTKVIHFLAALFRNKLYLLESPPPSPSEEHLRTALDQNAYLIENVGRYGISPAPLRLGLWRIRSEIMKKITQALSCVYLTCPTASQDDAGYLIEPAWSNATHANERYGAMVVEQIADVIKDA